MKNCEVAELGSAVRGSIAMEDGAVVVARLHVLQKVGHGLGRFLGVQFDADVTLAGLQLDGLGRNAGCQQQSGQEQGGLGHHEVHRVETALWVSASVRLIFSVRASLGVRLAFWACW